MTRLLTLVVLAVFLVIGVLLPVGLVLWEGLHPARLAEVLAHPAYRAGLLNALQIAVVVTGLCLLITLPLALLAWRFRFRGKGLAEALLLAPLILPPFVGALGVQQLFGQYGAVNALGLHLGLWSLAQAPDWLGAHRFAAVCLIEAFGLYPVLYLTLSASLGRLDPALLEAAAASGAGPFTRLRRVLLPLLRPGLFAGGSVVFVWSFTELGTPLMLAYDRVAPVQIFNGLQDLHSNRLPLALAVIMLAVAAGVFALFRAWLGRPYEVLVAKGGGQDASRPLHGWRAACAWLPFLLVAGIAAAPHAAVVLLSVAGDWYKTVLPAAFTLARYQEALAHPQVVPSIINSLGYATAATLLASLVGLGLGWATVRWKAAGSRLLDAVAMIPLAVPGLIMAFGFLGLGLLVGTWSPTLRPFCDPQANPALLLILAYAVRRLPLVLRSVDAGLSQAPVVLEEAAASCGAGPLTRLRRITLPLIAASLLAGALMTFSFSMLEVSDSLILAQARDHWPITKVIYDLVTVLGSGAAVACAFATWAMLFLAGCLGAAAVFLGRGPTGMFRA